MHHRLKRIQQELDQQQLDALLVTNAANRRYVSGFTGSAGALVITAKHALLLSDGRYTTQATREAPAFEWVLLSDAAPLSAQLPEIVQRFGIRRFGFEADDVSVAQFNKFQQKMHETSAACEWIPTAGLVEQLRQVKDADEIEILRRAVAITDAAFAAIRPLLRPEMRERDVAWELEKAMRERGADGLAFEIIVAAGPNGALPHARPSDGQLGIGRPIVMDFGAKVAGYHGDMTRTVILGEADEHFWQVYTAVLNGQNAAIRAARAGMFGWQVDAAAREAIEKSGYGDAFTHGLGHGVGLQIHEGPAVRRLSQDVLPVGAIFSVEPGIYLPDWGGVRIEDLGLLADGGLDVLTQSSKEPLIEI